MESAVINLTKPERLVERLGPGYAEKIMRCKKLSIRVRIHLKTWCVQIACISHDIASTMLYPMALSSGRGITAKGGKLLTAWNRKP